MQKITLCITKGQTAMTLQNQERAKIQIWPRCEKNKRHRIAQARDQEDTRNQNLDLNHTSLGGQVVSLLGFGSLDWGSILPTDISFLDQ